MLKEVKEGLKDSIVFGVGFIFLYLSIGMLSATQSFSLSQALAASIIIFSAMTAFAFRLLPFFMKNSTLLNNQQGNLYCFLSYSTQAMLGVIIDDHFCLGG